MGYIVYWVVVVGLGDVFGCIEFILCIDCCLVMVVGLYVEFFEVVWLLFELIEFVLFVFGDEFV